MTEIGSPPPRVQSARESLLQALSSEPVTARELSQLTGMSERDVCSHLQHIQKSLKTKNRQLLMSPATCLDCQFIFQKRERVTRPGKCPVCRSTHLSEPLFALKE